MRGLSQYIADLHACASRADEERRVNEELARVREKLHATHLLGGYQRKKCVAKLVYTHMLGYDVDAGAYVGRLMCSPRYSEKYMGYLAHALLHGSATDQLGKDVAGPEPVACLALAAIAHAAHDALALAPSVLALATAPTSSPHVCRRATLALIALHRHGFPTDALAEERSAFARMLHDSDVSTAMAAAALLTRVADDPAFAGVCDDAILRLERTTEPWLQLRLLQLLQACDPRESAYTEELPAMLGTLMHMGSADERCIRGAVALEALRVAARLGASVPRAHGLVGSMLDMHDANMRYLALDALGTCADKAHAGRVLALLRADDESLRCRALGVVCALSDAHSYAAVLGDVLHALPSAPHDLQRRAAVQAARMCAEYAADRREFTDAIFSLVRCSGAAGELWPHLARARDEAYAAECALACVQSAPAEALVQLAAYVLGEWAACARCTPREQLALLAAHAHPPQTTCLLLTLYARWLCTFPELRPDLVHAIRAHCASRDPEVQQRACEYAALAEFPSVLEQVLDCAPPARFRPLCADAVLAVDMCAAALRLHIRTTNTAAVAVEALVEVVGAGVHERVALPPGERALTTATLSTFSGLHVRVAHGTHVLIARVPVTLFVTPVALPREAFFVRWRALSAAFEAQMVADAPASEPAFYESLVAAAGLAVLAGVDPRPTSVVGAGMLGGAIACLVRVEPYAPARQCRVTVRTTSSEASGALAEALVRAVEACNYTTLQTG